MKAKDKLASIIEDNGGKLVIDGIVNFYGNHISGKLVRIEQSDDYFVALVDCDGYLFNEVIPGNEVNDRFVDNINKHIKK